MDKSKMMMIIIIALLVLLLGTVVGVAVHLVFMGGDDVTVWNEPGQPGVVQPIRPADVYGISLERITTSLAPGPGGRVDSIIVEPYVGLDGRVDEEELNAFINEFNRGINLARAEAIRVFLALEFDEIRTNEGRDAAAEILKNRLQELFESNLIVKVSFPEWNVLRGR
ncbi:MAG: hypothetical protein FWF79_08930 [Defluviitaleaceae bacterium]|nr:hypothetical protein [Defluviitaleaceae bacterium]